MSEAKAPCADTSSLALSGARFVEIYSRARPSKILAGSKTCCGVLTIAAAMLLWIATSLSRRFLSKQRITYALAMTLRPVCCNVLRSTSECTRLSGNRSYRSSAADDDPMISLATTVCKSS
jgi:hypothetical protein